jgi:hypothetical protein
MASHREVVPVEPGVWFPESFTSFLLAARTEATRMFSTIQPGERLNDGSTGLEGERLVWAHKSRFFFALLLLTPFPRKQ